jgi:hypothetical protein
MCLLLSDPLYTVLPKSIRCCTWCHYVSSKMKAIWLYQTYLMLQGEMEASLLADI